MSNATLAQDSTFPAGPVAARDAGRRSWRIAAIAILSTRVIQGFIYWGGGSRRFIYAPDKLDPDLPDWMANKFQTAMPGAILGTGHIIDYLLTHFWLLYAGIILFSAAELVAGLMLMSGLLTRLAAAASMGFSIVLMLMFGWQGATCVDEWTMAACNLAMGTTLLLAGSGAYSLDNVLLRRKPALAERGWFRWLGGSLPLPLSDTRFRNLALALLAFVVVFDVGTYSYFRGAVLTPYHDGPVSPSVHHLTLDDAVLGRDGGVRFHAYLDGGAPEVPAHVMLAELTGADGRVLASWDTSTLTALPQSAIRNDYLYNKFKAGPYGLVAEMGAKATITLPPAANWQAPGAGPVTLRLTDVNDHSFTIVATAAE